MFVEDQRLPLPLRNSMTVIRYNRSMRLLAGSLVAATLMVASTAALAQAEAGTGNPFGLGFGENARLLPVLHPLLAQDVPTDGLSYQFEGKGFFKVGGKTVARLPAFDGIASPTSKRVVLRVSRKVRHAVNAAARRTGSKRTVLTITFKTTERTYAQDVYLNLG